MDNKGFEVELKLAFNYLLKGRPLTDDEYQVINCATPDELATSFQNVYNQLMYEKFDENETAHFNANLQLLEQLRNNQAQLQGNDKELLVPMTREEIQKRTLKDVSEIAEIAIKRLLKGELLSSIEILALNSASDIELLDIFTHVYSKKIEGISEDLSEMFRLNMFVLKSLKLVDSITILDENVKSIDRTQYEKNFEPAKKFVI